MDNLSKIFFKSQIDAATVVDNLQKCPQFDHKLPTAEGQVRSLTKLEAS